MGDIATGIDIDEGAIGSNTLFATGSIVGLRTGVPTWGALM